MKNILIVGTGKRAQSFIRQIELDQRNKVIGLLDFDSSLIGKEIFGYRVLGDLKSFDKIFSTMVIDEVIFIIPRGSLEFIKEYLKICEKIGVKSKIAVDIFQPYTSIAKVRWKRFGGKEFLIIDPVPHPRFALFLKRIVDIVFSALLLIIISPLFLIIAIGIKLDSNGSVLFVQERVGLNGRRFRMLKFRTMVEDAEEQRTRMEHLNEMSGPIFKIKNDPRVTMFGKLLRIFSIDEIPQLLNVLKGNMSLVGPRPPLPHEVSQYNLITRRRLSVKPGLTCLWQINGRNELSFDKWMALDMAYIDNWSFGLDLVILLKTIPVVLRGKGV